MQKIISNNKHVVAVSSSHVLTRGKKVSTKRAHSVQTGPLDETYFHLSVIPVSIPKAQKVEEYRNGNEF